VEVVDADLGRHELVQERAEEGCQRYPFPFVDPSLLI